MHCKFDDRYREALSRHFCRFYRPSTSDEDSAIIVHKQARRLQTQIMPKSLMLLTTLRTQILLCAYVGV